MDQPKPLHNLVQATPHAKSQAKNLRADLSLPEVMLWQRLKGKQLGVKFRRQHPIGPYIADFYCHDQLLVIEIDGREHQGDRKQRDTDRDQWMTQNRIRVIRVIAADVLRDCDAVAAWLKRQIEIR